MGSCWCSAIGRPQFLRRVARPAPRLRRRLLPPGARRGPQGRDRGTRAIHDHSLELVGDPDVGSRPHAARAQVGWAYAGSRHGAATGKARAARRRRPRPARRARSLQLQYEARERDPARHRRLTTAWPADHSSRCGARMNGAAALTRDLRCPMARGGLLPRDHRLAARDTDAVAQARQPLGERGRARMEQALEHRFAACQPLPGDRCPHDNSRRRPGGTPVVLQPPSSGFPGHGSSTSATAPRTARPPATRRATRRTRARSRAAGPRAARRTLRRPSVRRCAVALARAAARYGRPSGRILGSPGNRPPPSAIGLAALCDPLWRRSSRRAVHAASRRRGTAAAASRPRQAAIKRSSSLTV